MRRLSAARDERTAVLKLTRVEKRSEGEKWRCAALDIRVTKRSGLKDK